MSEPDGSQNTIVLPRDRMIWHEVKKGAWFGAKWMAVLLTLIYLIPLVLFGMEFIDKAVEYGFDVVWERLGGTAYFLKNFGLAVITILAISGFTAIISGVIAALVSLCRKRSTLEAHFINDLPELTPLGEEGGDVCRPDEKT